MGVTVLVVDDAPTFRYAARSLLPCSTAPWRFEAESAGGDRYREAGLPIGLMDINMFSSMHRATSRITSAHHRDPGGAAFRLRPG